MGSWAQQGVQGMDEVWDDGGLVYNVGVDRHTYDGMMIIHVGRCVLVGAMVWWKRSV